MKTDREMEIRILEALEKNAELERRVLEDIAGKRGQNGEDSIKVEDTSIS